MELRVLRYFLAVAREGSLTAAADVLHLTQPTLSRQIRDLEEELGKRLLLRKSHRVELTPEGVLLRKRAEEIVAMADKTEAEFAELRRELQETGYLRRSGKEKKGREKPIAPREFRSSSGLRILVGRSNVQNDALTRKADKRDLWLHTQKIHGSHVILCTEDGAYDDESLHEAALLAAYYSQAQGGSNVPVDYTSVKYVKKPAGARPGMVVYETYRTLYVTPDEETIRRLDRKNK